MAFDLLIRGGLLIDGTGAAARRADVGMSADRITAIGDLSGVGDVDVASVIEASGHVVAPGFDPQTVNDLANSDRPAVYPAGIRDVIVDGRRTVPDGLEPAERPGRLPRHRG